MVTSGDVPSLYHPDLDCTESQRRFRRYCTDLIGYAATELIGGWKRQPTAFHQTGLSELRNAR